MQLENRLPETEIGPEGVLADQTLEVAEKVILQLIKPKLDTVLLSTFQVEERAESDPLNMETVAVLVYRDILHSLTETQQKEFFHTLINQPDEIAAFLKATIPDLDERLDMLVAKAYRTITDRLEGHQQGQPADTTGIATV